jgi:hypothetical protein
MTSSAAAAKELAKALSPSEEKLSELKEYAEFCGIPRDVVNQLTRLELEMTAMFTRTTEILAGLLEAISNLETFTERQHALYREIMVLKNAIDLYQSCKHDPAKMLQWVRGFSALWIVSVAMSENGIKSGVFGGHEGVFHFRRPAWSGDSNKYGNVLSSMNLLMKKMAKWAGVQQGKNQEVDDEVDDLILDAPLANLQEDPIKLRGIDRLVQAFADEAAGNIHAKLAPAGTKTCPGA